MNSGINYLIRSGLLTENTGALKIFYDFKDTGCYGGNYSFINSISVAEQDYSGILNIYAHQIGSEILEPYADYSYTVKDGYINLIGNDISAQSGIISEIRIQNSENLYSGNDFTFIIEGGKIPRDEAKEMFGLNVFDEQLPIHNKEIIFSNISGEQDDYRGWEFGLNGINLFYFKTMDVGQQKVLTYNNETPYGENIWALRYLDDVIYVSRYDVEKNKINTNKTVLGAELLNGGIWRLNSGECAGLQGICGGATGITSSIKLRKFLYFNEYLSDEQIRIASEYMTSEIGEVSYIKETGSEYVYIEQEICTGISGLLYITGILSGYSTEFVEITGDPVFTGISGVVNSGDAYISEYDEEYGIFYEDIYLPTGDQPYSIIGVTGYMWDYPVETVEVTGDAVYIQSGVSGVIYSGCWTEEELIETPYKITGYMEDIISNESQEHLRARSFSYLGKRYVQDFGELSVAKNVWSGSQKMVNNLAREDWGYYKDGHNLFVYLETGINEDWMNLYMNGAALRKGTGTPTKVVIEGTEYNAYLIDKDFLYTGNNEIVTDLLFTGVDQIENLHGVFDITYGQEYGLFEITGAGTNGVNGIWERKENKNGYPSYKHMSENYTIQHLVIQGGTYLLRGSYGEEGWGYLYNKVGLSNTGKPWEWSWSTMLGELPVPSFRYMGNQDLVIDSVSKYSEGSFAEIAPSGRAIFFNGVKLYEGVDYVSENGYFRPSGYLTGMTGLYFSFPMPETTASYTGEMVYDIYGTGYLEYDSVIPRINGLRKDTREYVYHDSYVDLLKGMDINPDFGSGFYEGFLEV